MIEKKGYNDEDLPTDNIIGNILDRQTLNIKFWNIDMDTVLYTPLHKVADNVADMPGKQIFRKFSAWSRHLSGLILKRGEGDTIG
ncbi:MAG: hypothetical protein KAJ45_03815 [Desulfobulbaceae bacterium]|nr:hypothetical protein [Desulfobulbaceae bacterium]